MIEQEIEYLEKNFEILANNVEIIKKVIENRFGMTINELWEESKKFEGENTVRFDKNGKKEEKGDTNGNAKRIRPKVAEE